MSPSPSPYVDLPVTSDITSLQDIAIEYLQRLWPDWVPNDGNLEVRLIEALSPMAQNAAQLAADMPAAALIAFGEKLLEVPYNEGAPATATATFTAPEGTTIPVGSEVQLGSVIFHTTAALTVAAGKTSVSGEVVANEVGEEGNNLTAVGWRAISLPIAVTEVTLAANTSGGQNPEDDNAYLERISERLRLRAKSAITLDDLEIIALQNQAVSGATALGTATKPRQVTVYLRGPSGLAVAKSVKEALEAEYAKTRMVNATISLGDPTLVPVSVLWRAQALPGYSSASLVASGNAALTAALEPQNWGAATPDPGKWTNQTVVYRNKLIQAISGVPGIDYVESLSIGGAAYQLSRPVTNGVELKEIWVALAAGQSGWLSATLSTGAAITSLPTSALSSGIPSGAQIMLNDGAGHTQSWVTTAAVEAGAKAIPVTSQVPNFAYPLNTTKVEGATQGLTSSVNNVGSNGLITLTDPTGAHTQTFQSAGTFAGTPERKIEPVTAKPLANFGYPIGTTVTLALNGLNEGYLEGDLTLRGAAPLPTPGTMTGQVDSSTQ